MADSTLDRGLAALTLTAGTKPRAVRPTRETVGLLPSQLLGARHAFSPEMRLVAAILEDAVHCVLQNVGARSGTRWREFIAARNWLLDEARDWPFAFANICDLVGLDAAAVRSQLQEALHAPAAGTRTPSGAELLLTQSWQVGRRSPPGTPPPAPGR